MYIVIKYSIKVSDLSYIQVMNTRNLIRLGLNFKNSYMFGFGLNLDNYLNSDMNNTILNPLVSIFIPNKKFLAF